MFEKLKELFEKYPDRCCLVIVALAAVLPFLPSLNFAPFMLDDNAYIGQEYLFSFSWKNIKYHLTSKTVGLHSPLVMLSFMPDYLLWGKELFHGGARFFNILLHCGGMMLFYLILRKLAWQFKDGRELSFPPMAAMFAAVAAACHPQRVESVVWLAERKDVLVVTFGLATIYTFIEAYRNKRIPIAAPVLLFLSLWGIKPMMISLPLILTVGWIAAEKRWDFRKAVHDLSGVYLVTVLYLLMNFQLFAGFSSAAMANAAGNSGASRIPLATYNILVYFFKTLFPVNLNPLYPLHVPAEISWIFPVLILGIIAALIIPAVLPGNNRELLSRTLLPCGLMFGLAVFPVCNLKAIGNVDFADRYSYFPSLFVWAAVAGSGVLICREYFQFRKLAGIVSGGYLAVLLILTAAYMPAWKSSETQLDAMLDTDRPHLTALKLAAVADYKNKDYDKVINYILLLQERGKDNPADHVFCEGMLGLVEIRQGQTQQGISRINSFLSTQQWMYILQSPFSFIRECILISAAWHLQQGKNPENLRYASNLFIMLSQAAESWSVLESLNYRGVAMMISGRYAEAEQIFTQALKFAPSDKNIQNNLRQVRLKK